MVAWLNGLERRFADRILPIDPAIARVWAQLHAARQQASRPLAMADGLIAATAQVTVCPSSRAIPPTSRG